MIGLLSKVCQQSNLHERLGTMPRPFVFTNGVFDVLHRGHVSCLYQAATLGGSLIVGINSDNSARMLGKGPDRPLNRAEDRAAVLAGLESVTLVTFFDELTPVELIKVLRPDICVKGLIMILKRLRRLELYAAGAAMLWPSSLWLDIQPPHWLNEFAMAS